MACRQRMWAVYQRCIHVHQSLFAYTSRMFVLRAREAVEAGQEQHTASGEWGMPNWGAHSYAFFSGCHSQPENGYCSQTHPWISTYRHRHRLFQAKYYCIGAGRQGFCICTQMNALMTQDYGHQFNRPSEKPEKNFCCCSCHAAQDAY